MDWGKKETKKKTPIVIRLCKTNFLKIRNTYMSSTKYKHAHSGCLLHKQSIITFFTILQLFQLIEENLKQNFKH